MARIRSVHPGLFKDEAFMELSMGARVLLIGVWTIADDHGVFEWKPKAIRAEIFPGDNVEIELLLGELVTHQCVVRFEDCGRPYAVVRNFCLYQRPREPSYRLPFPQDIHSHAGIDRRKAEDLVKSNGKPAASLRQDSVSPTENRSHRRGEKGREGKRDNPKSNIETLERVPPAKSDEYSPDQLPSPSAPDSLSEVSKPVLKEVERAKPASLGMAIGTELPKRWTPDEELCDQVKAEFGMTDDDIRTELTEFHRQHGNGSFSANWRGSFGTWCKRWKEHRDKQAPPRVQVSNTAPKRVEDFTEADWDKVAAFYAKTGRWTRDSGADPMSRSCRCPKAILEKHNIDPESGERRIPPPRKPDAPEAAA